MLTKFQRAECNNSGVTSILVGNGQTKATGTSFPLFFFIIFFNPLYYSYEMCLQIFEGLSATVAELHQF